tara:strand:+ start:716 stop:1420 length:705 start_codon:yes stop_codon:yes gene_type:complete
MRFIIFLSHFFLLSTFISAQDILFKKSGEEIEVKITEVADDYLKYKKKDFENGPDFKISVSDVFMVKFENGEKLLFDKPIENKDVFGTILGGTSILVTINETISSDKKFGRPVTLGEVIKLSVQNDVLDTKGNILVKSGTPVIASITEVRKRKAAGTKGKLSFKVNSITAVDNQPIPVNLTFKFEGKSKVGVAVGAAAVVAAPLLLLKGKAAVVEQGSVFEATVISNREIKLTN